MSNPRGVYSGLGYFTQKVKNNRDTTRKRCAMYQTPNTTKSIEEELDIQSLTVPVVGAVASRLSRP